MLSTMLQSLFYLSLITLSLGQLTAITAVGDSHIYLFDLVVGIYAIYGIFWFAVVKKSLIIPKNAFLFIVFSVVAGLSLVPQLEQLTRSQLLVSSFYLFRWLFYLGAGITTFNMVGVKKLSRETIINAVVTSGIFIALAGFIQLIILPDFAYLHHNFGWDPHKNRLASTFLDPNFAGGYMVLCLTLLLEKNLSAKTLTKIAILTLAIVLTFSRSSWLMLAIVIFIFGLRKSPQLLVTAGLIAFLAYFAVPRVQTRITGATDPADSAHFRLISWKNTLAIAQDNLGLGVGFNAFRYAQKEYGVFDVGESGSRSGAGSDSSMLLILATTGAVGFCLFLGGYGLVAIQYPVLLGGLFAHSQFVNSLFYPPIMFLWLTIVAFQITHRVSHT